MEKYEDIDEIGTSHDVCEYIFFLSSRIIRRLASQKTVNSIIITNTQMQHTTQTFQENSVYRPNHSMQHTSLVFCNDY